MTARLDPICRTVLRRATDAVSVTGLGTEISHQVARVIPHDGYLLVGLDPAEVAGCFHTGVRGYRSGVAHRLRTDAALDAHPHPFARLAAGPCPVGAARLARPLAAALMRFVGGKALRPSGRKPLPPAVVVIGADDRIMSMTPSGQEWLRELGLSSPSPEGDEPTFVGAQLNMTHLARPSNGPAVTRIPMPQGWVVLHAQGLLGAGAGEAGVTIQGASAPLPLPAVAA
ncbi:hypothetical protein ACFYNY_07300 [Streptomyces sp. NPDC006530]|uniref:hypothetical protein n=1 Tax=Streptomyces sp. NPDC006530 TaxID=3364750 RepID=UPI0036926206